MIPQEAYLLLAQDGSFAGWVGPEFVKFQADGSTLPPDMTIVINDTGMELAQSVSASIPVGYSDVRDPGWSPDKIPDGLGGWKISSETTDTTVHFSYINPMTATVMKITCSQSELDKLTLVLNQADSVSMGLVATTVNGEAVTLLREDFRALVAEYSQTLLFANAKSSSVTTGLVNALNTYSQAELLSGTSENPVVGSKSAKIATIQLTNHALAFKTAYGDGSAVTEGTIVSWIIQQRGITPFIVD